MKIVTKPFYFYWQPKDLTKLKFVSATKPNQSKVFNTKIILNNPVEIEYI